VTVSQLARKYAQLLISATSILHLLAASYGCELLVRAAAAFRQTSGAVLTISLIDPAPPLALTSSNLVQLQESGQVPNFRADSVELRRHATHTLLTRCFAVADQNMPSLLKDRIETSGNDECDIVLAEALYQLGMAAMNFNEVLHARRRLDVWTHSMAGYRLGSDESSPETPIINLTSHGLLLVVAEERDEMFARFGLPSPTVQDLGTYFGASPILCPGKHLEMMSKCATGRDRRFVVLLNRLLRGGEFTLHEKTEATPKSQCGANMTSHLIAFLPGIDGSTIHCRPLIAWLSQIRKFKTVQLSIDEFHGKLTLEASATWCADKIMRERNNDEHVSLVAYSAGGILVPVVCDELIEHGIRMEHLIFLEPPSPDYEGGIMHPGQVVAPSVLDAVPPHMDFDAFEKALIDVFPTYAKRLRSTRKFNDIIQSARYNPECCTAYPGVSELIINSAQGQEPLFCGFSDNRPWASTTKFEKCNHVQLPYHLPAIEFLVATLVQTEHDGNDDQGRVAFTETNKIMEKARADFRATWQKHPSADKFRSSMPAEVHMPGPKIARDGSIQRAVNTGDTSVMSTALLECGLQQYVVQARTCWDALGMDRPSAEQHLKTRAGMKPGHCRKFFKYVWTKLSIEK